MRKWLWFAAAAAVIGGGGVGYYAWQKPQSAIGQLIVQVGEFGIQVNPVTQMTRQVLAAARMKQQGTVCPHSRPCQEEVAPDDPTPAEEPAGKLVEGTVENVPAMQLPSLAEQNLVSEGPLGVFQVQSSPPETDPVPPLAAEPGPCPRSMPYCPTEGEGKQMPPATEASADPYDPSNFGSQAVTPGAPGSNEEAETKPDEGTNAMGSSPDYYQAQQAAHSRYIVCPYSGKCIEASPSCDSNQNGKPSKSECPRSKEPEAERIAPPTEEESEAQEPEATPTAPKTKKYKKPAVKTQSRYFPNLPLAPYVDTMEYRSSDRSLNETGPGPF